MRPPRTHLPLCSFPSTYAPVKPFLRVDKEKVCGTHPCHCLEPLYGHGLCHLITPQGSQCSLTGSWCQREHGWGRCAHPGLFSQVQIYNPAFFKYIHDRWTEHHGRYPSTGMLVLFFALHVCDEVGDVSFSSWLAWSGFAEVLNLAGLRKEVDSLGQTAAVTMVTWHRSDGHPRGVGKLCRRMGTFENHPSSAGVAETSVSQPGGGLWLTPSLAMAGERLWVRC